MPDLTCRYESGSCHMTILISEDLILKHIKSGHKSYSIMFETQKSEKSINRRAHGIHTCHGYMSNQTDMVATMHGTMAECVYGCVLNYVSDCARADMYVPMEQPAHLCMSLWSNQF